MESNLRPLTLGEILDRTAQLYRTNFLLFAGIYSVYAGALLVLGLLQIGADEVLRARHLAKFVSLFDMGWAFVILPLSFIFAGAALAANNRAVSWVHMGEPATIRRAYSSILPRLGRYLWLMTIMAFRIWAPFFLFAIVAGAVIALIPGIFTGQANPSNPQTAMVIGIVFIVFALCMIPWIAYAIFMALRYSLAVPACVIEDLKARQAIRRSIELSKDSRGRIFLLGLLIIVIQVGLVLFAQIFFVVAAVRTPSHVLPAWLMALQQIVGFFTNSFIGPMWATGLTLFYYDQRIRKEGFDIEWMMQAAGMTLPEPAAASPATAQPLAAEPSAAERPAADALASPEQPPAPADPASPPDPVPDTGSTHE
jgi:MFS family permease